MPASWPLHLQTEPSTCMTSRGAAWWPAYGITASTLTGEHTISSYQVLQQGSCSVFNSLPSNFLW